MERVMNKEAFKFLLDCVIDVTGLAESYKHGKRNCETVFCNLVAAKIAHEKFGLTLMKIAEYLDNQPKRSALSLGLRNMNEHVRWFGGYYIMNMIKKYNVEELIRKVIDEFYRRINDDVNSYFNSLNLPNADELLGFQASFDGKNMVPAIAVDERGYYHIAVYSNGVWYSITSHKIIECKIVKLRYI